MRRRNLPIALFLILTCCPTGGFGSDEFARQILDDAGIRGGLIVHVGAGDGRLAAALGTDDRYRVHGLDTEAKNVEAARHHIRSLGQYGRVSVTQYDGQGLPYADNMVNLLVVEPSAAITKSEAFRVLVPTGVACFRSGDTWTKTVKPWPAEIDEWTHWLHAADGNAVAEDTVAGPPRRLQWVAKPFWSRHHNTVPSVTNFVSAAGRAFYVVDKAPGGMDGSAPDRWALVARDAFNGLPLWRKPMPDWGWQAWSDDWKCRFTVPTHIARRLVASGDRVYATLGFNAPLTELDAATGEVLRTFEGSEHTDEILLLDGRLIVAINSGPQHPGTGSDQRRGEEGEPPVRKSVAMIDVKSGKMRWKRGQYVGLRSKTGSMERISHLSMCAGDGRIFFVDGQRIVCLSMDNGRELWTAERPEIPEHKMRYNIRFSDMCSLVYHDGTLYFAQVNPVKRVGWRGERARLHAFSADSGKELWDRQCASWGWGHPADVFVVDGLVWVHDFETPNIMGLDPATGEIERQVSNFEAFDNGHHHRCYRNKATTRFLITSYRGLEFLDYSGETTDLNHWVRGTCRLGEFPCNGMVYATPHPCSCYLSSKLNGFLALAPEDARQASEHVRRASEPVAPEASNSQPNSHPLEHGPAFDQPLSAFRSPLSDAWPMYRRDPRRSGTTATPLSANLNKAWQVDLGGRPTGCTVAGSTVLAAVPESHQVVALNIENGRERWTFTTGGPVDTPPTIDAGRAYFGCNDGWLYCVRLSDGELIWRLRGAPSDRLIGAFDGIESAWPIHGSPLVKDGVVYFTAGRSSFLDGGILAFSVDAKTGNVLSRYEITSPQSMAVDAGTNRLIDSGLLQDLLVAHGDAIAMRQRQIFPAMGPLGDEPVLRTTGGMLDDEWFSRTRWFLGDRPLAEYLVFDSTTVYGVRAREGTTGYEGFITPGQSGYKLFAAETAQIMAMDPKKVVGPGRHEGKAPLPEKWARRVPVRVTSMLKAGDTLFAAGTPDRLDPTEPWAAYQGRRGGRLLALSAADGQIIAEYELKAPSVLDGLAAAGNRLFVSTVDGKIVSCTSDVP